MPFALENELEIIDNKALLLTLRNPHRVTTVIPKSRELPNNQVLVHWGLDEAQVLKNLRVKNVPSPIMGRYDWPGQYKPFDHQKTTAAFLTMNRRAFCLNEQGTGKTGSVIWAADYLLKQKRIRRVLVICPLSIMDSAWRADLFKFAMHRSVDIAYGAKEKRKAIINGIAEFVIINYDGVEIVAEDIAKGGFDLIVIDEANAYKNVQTKRWKVLNSLVKAETWLWMMTGTPAAQSPLDAYGLAKLVNPQGVPKFFTTFRDMVMTKLNNFRWLAKETATQTVFECLQPAIRYTKDECLDLPEMTYTKRRVELTKQQERYYGMLKSRMVVQAAGEEITSVNAAVNMSKLLQISCGAVYSDSGETLEFDIKNRYNVLTEVIDESSQKVLVFVPFKHVISILTDKLNADGYITEVISGDVPVHKRTDIFNRFQTEPNGTKVLVIQPQAAAHGVTLTAANTVVWWGPTSSLETYAQANARVHRSGQRHPSTVVQLVGSGVERHVYNLLDNKIDVHSKIVDLYKEILE
jgi:SNF2 family DNA or RNA helicase